MKASDIQQALNTVLREYLEFKLRDLKDRCECFEKKWHTDFENFKKNIRKNTLKKEIYSFEVEQDFWEWEEAETLKNHMLTFLNKGIKKIYHYSEDLMLQPRITQITRIMVCAIRADSCHSWLI